MSGKIKVCHITSIHPSSDTRIFVKECTSLAAAGYDVSLVATNTENAIINGVKIVNAGNRHNNRILRMIFTSKMVYNKALSLNADIYQFHDPELIPIALKLVKKGKKVIYDVHEDIPRQILAKYYIPGFLRKIISKIIERKENNAASKFSWIITATPFIRDRFLKFNRNVTEVCNFPVHTELSSSTPYLSRPKHVCYVGSITKARGILEMVEAMNGLTYKLHLCGSFSPESLRAEAMSLPGWEQVVEHGYASRAKVKEVLDDSRVGLVTLHPIINYVDAYPVKMFEYMIAGIPVVASNIKLWKDIIDSSRAGICVDPYKPTEIKKAIISIMENDDVAQLMSSNGVKAVEEHYNWANEEKKLLEIYQKLSKA